MPATYHHLTMSGELETRTSRTRSYFYVVVGTLPADDPKRPGRDVVLRWSETGDAARKAIGAREFGAAADQHVERINDGQRLTYDFAAMTSDDVFGADAFLVGYLFAELDDGAVLERIAALERVDDRTIGCTRSARAAAVLRRMLDERRAERGMRATPARRAFATGEAS